MNSAARPVLRSPFVLRARRRGDLVRQTGQLVVQREFLEPLSLIARRHRETDAVPKRVRATTLFVWRAVPSEPMHAEDAVTSLVRADQHRVSQDAFARRAGSDLPQLRIET